MALEIFINEPQAEILLLVILEISCFPKLTTSKFRSRLQLLSWRQSLIVVSGLLLPTFVIAYLSRRFQFSALPSQISEHGRCPSFLQPQPPNLIIIRVKRCAPAKMT